MNLRNKTSGLLRAPFRNQFVASITSRALTLLLGLILFSIPIKSFPVDVHLSPATTAGSVLETMGVYSKAVRGNASLTSFETGSLYLLAGLGGFGTNTSFNTFVQISCFSISGAYYMGSLVTLFSKSEAEKQADVYNEAIKLNPDWTVEQKNSLAFISLKKARDSEKNGNIVNGCYNIAGGGGFLIFYLSVLSANQEKSGIVIYPCLGLIAQGIYNGFFNKGPIEQIYDSYLAGQNQASPVSFYINPDFQNPGVYAGVNIAF